MILEKVYIGYDQREHVAYEVARASIQRHQSRHISISCLELKDLRFRGLYDRPTEVRDGKLWDVISEAPMSTEFAISRFLVPRLMHYRGWAVFMDCDVLIRTDIHKLFDLRDSSKAVQCVKHHYEPPQGVKMDGQEQTRYARKNWSSVMLFNCEHLANRALDADLVNRLPGRDLHRFCWLKDDEIGELEPSWNWLCGHSDPEIVPDIVHMTEGGPWIPGYEDVPYADEWRAELTELRSKSA